MQKYHVPFSRAVGVATPSLTLIILRKVKGMLGLDLGKLNTGVLITPIRVRFWSNFVQESLLL